MLAARRMIPASVLLAMALVPAPAKADAADVIISDNFYLPKTLTVQAGSTVLWEQQGNLPHNVEADDGTWNSHPACTPTVPGSCMRDGDTFSRAFPEPGTFGYYCRVHGGAEGVGMSGTVRVVEPGFVFPTTVDDVRATKSGTSLRVLGSATFGGVASLEVGTDPTGDGAQGYPAVLGFDLIKASIGQPDPASGDLSFIIDAADLPATGGVPEMAWYYWDFEVDLGAPDPALFLITGRFTDAARGARVPNFYLQVCPRSGGSVDCSDDEDRPLDAVMDGEANRITVSVPRSVLEQVVGSSIGGAEIQTSPEIAFPSGAAVLSVPANTLLGPTGDTVFVTGSYTVGERGIRVGIVPSGTTPVFDRTAELADNGSYTTTIDVTGFAPGTYDVWVEACFGSNCAIGSTPVTL
ncbi:MAG: cupredoxin domain-containing protein [Actinomycetota bacterium]